MKAFITPFAIASALIISAVCANAQTPLDPPGFLDTPMGRFAFTPVACTIFEEDGVLDIEWGGVGTAPDGTPFYFDFSATANELSLTLGVEEPFIASDREIRAGRYVTEEFTIEVDGNVLRIPQLVLADQDSAPLGTGSMAVDCSPRT